MRILAIQNRMGIGDTVIFLPYIEKISEKLKDEWLFCDVVTSEEEFYKLQLDFLINHQFHTEYMRKKGKKLKNKNIRYAHQMVKNSHH